MCLRRGGRDARCGAAQAPNERPRGVTGYAPSQCTWMAALQLLGRAALLMVYVNSDASFCDGWAGIVYESAAWTATARSWRLATTPKPSFALLFADASCRYPVAV
jgi:hypothetical protein